MDVSDKDSNIISALEDGGSGIFPLTASVGMH